MAFGSWDMPQCCVLLRGGGGAKGSERSEMYLVFMVLSVMPQRGSQYEECCLVTALHRLPSQLP